MKRKLLVVIFIIGMSLIPVVWADQILATFVERVFVAADEGKPAPVLSTHNTLTLKQAYQIQTLAVKQRLGAVAPAGFKAGLTSTSAQEKFAVKQAVAGVLLFKANHKTAQGRYVVDSNDFNNMMLEAEVGFRIKTAITERITDIETLKRKVDSVLPVVEFPDLSFDQPKALQGVDIIANNVIAKQFISGDELDPEALDVNALNIHIQKEGRLILEGQSRDAMGDQWQALLWLVNQTIDSGWQINSGQVMITGAIGKMLPAQPGFYQVDYGPLGQVSFFVE